MNVWEKAQQTTAEAQEIRRETEEALLSSMRTELDIVSTVYLLAQQEDGERRARHVKMAETAMKSVLKLAERVELSRQERKQIEQAKQNIRELVGRDCSQ
jgi:hypothetical protein